MFGTPLFRGRITTKITLQSMAPFRPFYILELIFHEISLLFTGEFKQHLDILAPRATFYQAQLRRVETDPFSAEVGVAPLLRMGQSQLCLIEGRSGCQDIKGLFKLHHCQTRNFMKISRNLEVFGDLFKKVSMGLCEKV